MSRLEIRMPNGSSGERVTRFGESLHGRAGRREVPHRGRKRSSMLLENLIGRTS